MRVNFTQTITVLLIRCGCFSACCHISVYTQQMQFSSCSNSSFSQQRVSFSTVLLLLQKAVILDMFDYYFNQQWTLLAIYFPELWIQFPTAHLISNGWFPCVCCHCYSLSSRCGFHTLSLLHFPEQWMLFSMCCHSTFNKQWVDFNML